MSGLPENAGASPEMPAYPGLSPTLRSRIFLVIGAIFSLFLLRNVLFKDYNMHTRDYLTQTGHADDIGKILPSSPAAQAELLAQTQSGNQYLSSM